MNVLSFVLLAQLAAPGRLIPPVLVLPQPGVDDPSAYQGYQTRFYRDAAGNTVQIYFEGASGRLVHLLANADNESIGLTIRGTAGSVRLRHADEDARVSGRQGFRALSYRVVAESPHVHLGWFLLGSMRVERDFQYWERHRQPFAAPPFSLAETDALLQALDSLPEAARRRHLALLHAPDVAALRRRMVPTVSVSRAAGTWTARVRQLSLDARDSLTLEVSVDTTVVAAARRGDSLSLEARRGSDVPFTIRVASSARALTPLSREEIFTPAFLAFLRETGDSAPLLERQVRGVELLSSREKLMAGLPAYATYFGRDMLVSSLMMRPIWRDEMTEFALASVLRKLSPGGQVSHEEALGGQAVREAAAEYAGLVRAALARRRDGLPVDSLLDRAYGVLRDRRQVRENYHMVDDELQFPVLAARWLADADVSDARKRAFLLDRSDGDTRLDRLLRELALVARMTAPYAASPVPTNLVPFAPRDTGWASASWRDSGAGYAGGRFAVDVNAIWAPHALDAMQAILGALARLGFRPDSLARTVPDGLDGPLGRYLRDSASLTRAADTWWSAWNHFVVTLSPETVRRRIQARVAALPAHEGAYWTDVMRRAGSRDTVTFLALALDAAGRPIEVMNTDPATGLFLGPGRGAAAQDAFERLMEEAKLFARPYPEGLYIDGVGPVVANDAYAAAPVWASFERDRYHGPRVVWGREVNLYLLGLADRIMASRDPVGANALRAMLSRVMDAAEASGFQSELWSYEVRNGSVTPVRYGTGSDVQLWSTTDLAVQYALWRLGTLRN